MGRAPISIPSGVNVSNSGLTYTVKVRHSLHEVDAQQHCAAVTRGCPHSKLMDAAHRSAMQLSVVVVLGRGRCWLWDSSSQIEHS